MTYEVNVIQYVRMLFIPSWLIALLTFPGIVMHEFAHKKFCNWTRVPVYKICYFRFGNPVGYVTHAQPTKYFQSFCISLGPLFLNSIITFYLSMVASHINHQTASYYILVWLAFSAGVHAFPSDTDAKNLIATSKYKGSIILQLFSFPFVGIIWLANKLKIVGFDLMYAIILVLLGREI